MQTNKSILTTVNYSSYTGDMLFTHDNLGVYLIDYKSTFMTHNIKLVKWEKNAVSEQEFDLTQERIEIPYKENMKMCLTKDDKTLFVGLDKRVLVYNTETMTITKEFNVEGIIVEISLINDAKSLFVASHDGN